MILDRTELGAKTTPRSVKSTLSTLTLRAYLVPAVILCRPLFASHDQEINPLARSNLLAINDRLEDFAPKSLGLDVITHS